MMRFMLLASIVAICSANDAEMDAAIDAARELAEQLTSPSENLQGYS